MTTGQMILLVCASLSAFTAFLFLVIGLKQMNSNTSADTRIGGAVSIMFAGGFGIGSGILFLIFGIWH